ncbi:hypothetical protein MMG03_000511 [Fibrobacter succinogenes]|nr:hypothetical protein [Fibrobacter succinogenes]SHK19594.1 hypothetical protein SAMN05720765_101172 [Fibrobacter sp. UWH6]
MPKFLLSILLFSVSSFALTLDQVRADLKSRALSQDSVEMSIRTTVNTPAGRWFPFTWFRRAVPRPTPR